MSSTWEGHPDPPPAVDRVVLDQPTIDQRVAELADQIAGDYGADGPLMVGVLEGARTFVRALSRNLPGAQPPEFIRTTRYGRTGGAQEIRIVQDVAQEIASRHVLLVQAIVDTGLTVRFLMQNLALRNPASLRVCTLLDRPALRVAEVPIQYLGFPVNEKFLVGYGLDYRDRYGDLPFVATLQLGESQLVADG